MSPVATVRVVSSAHHVGDTRLGRIADTLVKAGLEVSVEAVAEPGDSIGFTPRWPVTVKPRVSVPKRLFRALMSATAPSADVLVVLDPELVLPSLLWRRRTGGAVVVDVHEDYQAVLQDRDWSRGPTRLFMVPLVAAATWGAARADLTVLADDHLPPHRARQRLVIRNVPATGDITACETRTSPPRAVYVGDVRRSRGLHAMVEAVLAVPPWELDIIGPVADEDQQWLDAHVQESGGRIHVHGRVSFPRAWESVRGAAVGLLLLEPTPAFRAAIPTKLYEYLMAGLAIIATPLPRVDAILRQAGAGVTVPDAQSATVMLQRWLERPTELDRYRAHARTWSAEHLTADGPFEELGRRVAGLLHSSSPRTGLGGHSSESCDPC